MNGFVVFDLQIKVDKRLLLCPNLNFTTCTQQKLCCSEREREREREKERERITSFKRSLHDDYIHKEVPVI